MEGWRFDPPRNWPVQPGQPGQPGQPEPERGWRPPPEWGPLPPGHRLWVPEHPAPRRRAPSVAALGAVAALAVVAVLAPVSGDGGTRADVAWSAASAAPLGASVAGRSGAADTTSRTSTAASPAKSDTRSAPGATATRSATRSATSTPSSSAGTGAARGTGDGEASSASSPDTKVYENCAALREVYPHGVGRRSAVDHTSGTPVTGFRHNAKVYAANRARDGDGDGIACEM